MSGARLTRPTDASVYPPVDGLRILAFCEFVPWESCGGSDQVVWQVHRRLAAWGAQVTILTCAQPGARRQDLLHEAVRIVAVPSVDLARHIGAEATVSAALVGDGFRLARSTGPAVLHANSIHFQSSLVAALVNRRRRTPLVTTAHIGPIDNLRPALRRAVTTYERTFGRWILRRSDHVIAVSPAVAHHVRGLGVLQRNVTVIPNGVDTARFIPAMPIRVRDVPRVLFVGRLIPNKGPFLLLDALATLAARGLDFSASFVGDGPLRASLERAASAVPVEITFTGHVRDVRPHLADADILVRPSLTEGMPLAVLEAMAAGVCVIASQIDGNTDLVRHHETGLLFAPGDARALADRLAEALGNPGLRSHLARRAAAIATAHSWDETARRTGHVLATAAAAG